MWRKPNAVCLFSFVCLRRAELVDIYVEALIALIYEMRLWAAFVWASCTNWPIVPLSSPSLFFLNIFFSLLIISPVSVDHPFVLYLLEIPRESLLRLNFSLVVAVQVFIARFISVTEVYVRLMSAIEGYVFFNPRQILACEGSLSEGSVERAREGVL